MSEPVMWNFPSNQPHSYGGILTCRRIPRDLTEATLAGGTLSVVASIAMVLLFGMELQTYLSTSATTTVIIDRSRDGDVMRINFNFSFPALSCEFASVDVSDVLGTVSHVVEV